MTEEFLYIGGEEEMHVVYDAMKRGMHEESTPKETRAEFEIIQSKLLRKINTYFHGNDPDPLAFPLALIPQLREYLVGQEEYFQTIRQGDSPYRQRMGEAYDEVLHGINELLGTSEE
jgi:hypothetical protein